MNTINIMNIVNVKEFINHIITFNNVNEIIETCKD